MPNISGSQLLGLVHEATGARLADMDNDGFLERKQKAVSMRERGDHLEASVYYQPRHAFEGTAEEARKDAQVIRDNLKRCNEIFDIWNTVIMDMTRTEFFQWIEEWCVWLERSDGYEI